jgi:glycosyltransferase involved in cell wall biosynthesis
MTVSTDREPGAAEPAAAPARRVAIVAYFYPPLGGVAVARTLGFVRHLPANGWEPVVIAPAGSTYALRDGAAASSLADAVEVHRAPSPEPAHLVRLARRGIGMARAVVGAASGVRSPASSAAPASPWLTPAMSSPAEGSAAGPSPSVARGRLGPWPGRLRRAIWFPDDQAGWLPFAVLAVVAAHRRRPVEAIVSSSSPVTAHVAAWIASRIVGVPWVADFRDPWLDNPIEPLGDGLARWRRATLEAALVRGAARCTFATPGLAAAYARRYPRAARRFSVLPNGYEARDTARARGTIVMRREPGDPRRLVYAGSLYRPGELDLFLDGLARLANTRPGLRDRLRVTFVGAATTDCRAVADRWLADPHLAGLVELRGFVPRAEALALVAGADAALTLLGDGPGMGMFVGAKLYDYLALDRQVVAMLPPGDARDVLAGLGWGIVADPDPDSVAAALARFVDEPLPARAADPDRRYDRASTAGRLARLLDEVSSREAAP